MIKTRAPQRDLEGMEARRKRAAKLFAKGVTQADVARELEVSRQSVSRWHEAWSRGGTTALKGAGRAGRRPLLDRADLATVEKALRRGPRVSGFATEIWTLPRITELIATLTGVTYHPGHVWRIMGQLGWSPQRPARRALERNDDAIDEWVATRWAQVKKTPVAATRGWSSKTNQASR
jgi:transposase